MTLEDAVGVGRQDGYLAVVSTVRSDGTVQSSVVNAGIVTHPRSGVDVVAFVTYGRVKLANLRDRDQVTLTFRAGWQWATVEGRAQLCGPDDPFEGVTTEELRLLLRAVFTAAGGTHEDWAAFDKTMADDRRAVVLVSPSRIYSNRRR
jgi:PPOX class probable F420-dependent enzyme